MAGLLLISVIAVVISTVLKATHSMKRGQPSLQTALPPSFQVADAGYAVASNFGATLASVLGVLLPPAS